MEEVFTHLKPKDQLSCRQVCHLWNELLCRDTRLLKKSVGIHLEIDNEVQVNTEHPLTTILKQNPALKVRKLTLDAGLFMTENGGSAKLTELIEYFSQFGDKDLVTEVKVTYSDYQCLSFFNVVFTILELFKSIRILRLNVDGMDLSLNSHMIEFPAKWKDCRWNSVEELHFAYFEWDIHIFGNYMSFCEKLPNLKIISGVEGFNELFYRKYSQSIKFAYFSYDNFIELITANTGIQLKGVHIYGNNEFDDAENIWNFLNNNQTELDDISLNLDDIFHIEENSLKPFPAFNYDKVRLLRVHAPVHDVQAHRLQQDLLLFRNLTKLYVDLTNFGNCFYGHEIITTLSKLENLEYLTKSRVSNITCSECFNSLIKSVKNVKTLSICMPVALDDIKLIADTIPDLEDFKVVKFSSDTENHYEKWPEMQKLQDILIPFKADLEDAKAVSSLCKACPNLKNIRIFESDNLSEAILSVFVENLKDLEKMQFDNGVRKITLIFFVK